MRMISNNSTHNEESKELKIISNGAKWKILTIVGVMTKNT